MILFQTNKLSDKKIFPIIKKTPDFYKEIKQFIKTNFEKMTINGQDLTLFVSTTMMQPYSLQKIIRVIHQITALATISFSSEVVALNRSVAWLNHEK